MLLPVYSNSIDPETKSSPAMITGRPTRDPIPIPMGRYCPHAAWVETLASREYALEKTFQGTRKMAKTCKDDTPPADL